MTDAASIDTEAHHRRRLGPLGRFVSHPVIEIGAGLVMAAAAIWILTELPEVAHETKEQRTGYIGLLVLGAFVILRSLGLLAESVELLAEGTEGLRSGPFGNIARALGRFARHPAFELTAAAVLVLVGVIEAWEAWEEPGPHDEGIWCLGLIVIGVTMIARALFGLVLGARFYGHAMHHRRDGIPLLDRLYSIVHRPLFEVGVGVLIVALVLFEWIYAEPPEEEVEAAMAAESTFLLFGIARVLRFLPHLFAALEVVGTAEPEA